jgi:hypothetical protein
MAQATQVAPHRKHGYRKGMTAYRVEKPTAAAVSQARANPQHGGGGATQYYVPDNTSLTPLYSVPLRQWLVLDVSTGRLTGWVPECGIHPGLTRDELLALHGQRATPVVFNGEYRSFQLQAALLYDGRSPWPGVLTLYFRGQRLERVSIYLDSDNMTSWGDWTESKAKAEFDALTQFYTTEVDGIPKRYSWGSVSAAYDPRSGAGSIVVAYT